MRAIGFRGAAIAFVGALLVALIPLMASSKPSDRCDSGPVEPSTTPLGVGVGASSTSTKEIVHLCVDPDGAPGGAISGSMSPDLMRLGALYDGNAGEFPVPCLGGHVGVAISPDGPEFYGSPTGNFDGQQRDPAAIAESLAACLDVPAPPDDVPGLPDDVPGLPDDVPGLPDEVPDLPDEVPDVPEAPGAPGVPEVPDVDPETLIGMIENVITNLLDDPTNPPLPPVPDAPV